jgi:hypothetical protein
MNDALKDFFTAKEEEYFHKKNEEALLRLRLRDTTKPRLSPITGEPMEQVAVLGVVVDKCPTSGGIFLDAGELEQMLHAVRSPDTSPGAVSHFFHTLFSKKK